MSGKIITQLYPDGSTVQLYFDFSTGSPVPLTQEEFDALDKVKCPVTSVKSELVCIKPLGSTITEAVKGRQVDVVKTTFADMTVDSASSEIIKSDLFLMDGTNVTDTHEISDCPEPILLESEFCIAPDVVDPCDEFAADYEITDLSGNVTGRAWTAANVLATVAVTDLGGNVQYYAMATVLCEGAEAVTDLGGNVQHYIMPV